MMYGPGFIQEMMYRANLQRNIDDMQSKLREIEQRTIKDEVEKTVTDAWNKCLKNTLFKTQSP